jgi:hypothetical protein
VVSDRDAQWLGALGRANEVRRARARLKHELADGTVDIVDVLADPPPSIESARVKQLLLALPHFGPVKAGRLLARCHIADGKTVAGLSDRQRTALIDQVVALSRAQAAGARRKSRLKAPPDHTTVTNPESASNGR